MTDQCPHGMPYDRRCVFCEGTQPELADVKRWNAGDLYINDEVVKIEDHQAVITTLLQEVETLREHIYCLENPLARHEEAAPQDEETKP